MPVASSNGFNAAVKASPAPPVTTPRKSAVPPIFLPWTIASAAFFAASTGVSIGTVSLALNSPTRVRPETLERINEAIDELSFVPKAEAVVRARRGVGRVGVIAPFGTYPSFGRRLNGVLAALRGLSY